MVTWKILYSKRAQKDAVKIKACGLDSKARDLIALIVRNPFQTPPPYEKLLGAKNTYSRRINIRHRLVYEVRYAIVNYGNHVSSQRFLSV
ncbi:MAG: Txe/YoeB family addiction module toxin [Puniceicoccales bacterium]|jgi:Txe/YoeB family toxin of toxin-antitoxin system|nr:Txe/YoeB family addiction module toxin [Puniceicoccales bacterium]